MATRVNLLDRAPNILIRGLQVSLAGFENPTGLDRPLWRDYSKYDLGVNLTIAQLNGVAGAAFRYAMGWGGTDATFSDRWAQAGDMDDFYRTGYSVLYPSLDVEKQCDHWFTLFPKIDIIPRILDAELQDGQTDAKVGQEIWKACEIIKSYDGVYPIIYSRYLLLDRWLQFWSQEDIDKMWYWGARYLWDRTREHPGPPFPQTSMPHIHIPEERILLHQSADKKAPFPGETERSTIVDWDRWEIGNETEMHQWILDTWGEPEPLPPTDPELEERVGNLESEVTAIQAWIVDHEENHNDPGNGEDILWVTATDHFPLSIVVGHDAACSGDKEPLDYEGPPGKPTLEHPPMQDRVIIELGDKIPIQTQAWYSCKDQEDTPEIYAAGMEEYYIVAKGHPGEGMFCPKSKTR